MGSLSHRISRAFLPFLPLLATGCAGSSPEVWPAEPERPPWQAPKTVVKAAGTQTASTEPGVDNQASGGANSGKTATNVAAQRKNGPPEPPDAHPRIGAIGPHTWIWKRPMRKGLAIGKMRNGTSIRLKSPKPIAGPNCRGKWYAVEPRGYVCDDKSATLNLRDPYFQALAFSAPEPGRWPYRYAHANGAPMYSRVPTPKQWKKAERGYGPTGVWKSLGAWAKGHEENIVNEPIEATDERPYFFDDTGKRTAPGGNYDTRVLVWKKIPAGSMLAYSRSFKMYDRVWLLTPDTMVVPANRVSKMKRSTFRAVHFNETDMTLPFAWNRSKKPIPKYRRNDNGLFEKTDQTIAAKTPVEIIGKKIRKNGWVYYELEKEPGLFIGKTAKPSKQLDNAVVTVFARKKLPRSIDADEKWLEAKIVPGTLTAYIGSKPVMTTLFSPGKGGPPAPNFKFPEDHRKYATTATGYFPLEWKERVATMSNEKGDPKVLWFSDVPHQQYLRAPLVMHVAYWHEDYGIRKSAECLNVSPIDGLWLFGWSLPVLPKDWNAVGAGQGNGISTPVLVGINSN